MIQKTVKEWNRVIKLSRKPTRKEFIMISKITGMGIIVVGTVGFLIRMLIQLFQTVL
jgi:protein transport protein SEC61 subunit gamma-like protein